MKNIFSKSVMAAMVLAGGVTSASASSTITWDDSVLGGDNSFVFDELFISDISGQISQTDSNNDGTLVGDTFVEVGLTGAVRFSLDGVNLSDTTTGLVNEYEVLFSLNMTGSANAVYQDLGTPSTADDFITLTALFDSSSTIDLWYDTTVDNMISGGATQIGAFGGLSGGCAITNFLSGVTAGGCDFNADFDLLVADLMTHGGTSLDVLAAALIPVFANFDINVDELSPGFEFVYPDGAGTTQVSSISHDGTMRFVVPEPGSLALIAAGLLGVAGAARRRKQA